MTYNQMFYRAIMLVVNEMLGTLSDTFTPTYLQLLYGCTLEEAQLILKATGELVDELEQSAKMYETEAE